MCPYYETLTTIRAMRVQVHVGPWLRKIQFDLIGAYCSGPISCIEFTDFGEQSKPSTESGAD